MSKDVMNHLWVVDIKLKTDLNWKFRILLQFEFKIQTIQLFFSFILMAGSKLVKC